MIVGFLQFSPFLLDKEKNLNLVKYYIEKFAFLDLLVLPELFNSGYLFLTKEEVLNISEPFYEGKTSQFLKDLSKRYNIYIAGGLSIKENENLYNSSILTGPEGILGYYHKVHLFDREKLFFQKGKEYKVFNLKNGVKVGLMICFDWFFPEVSRILALKGADIILHPANLVMPYCPDAMITRSIENRVFTITADRIGKEERGGICLKYIGKSQITSYKGDLLIRAGDKETLGFVKIDSEKARDKNLNKRNNIFKEI